MTGPRKTVVFIVADEKVNAGERDYMLALTREIKEQGLLQTRDYQVFKILPQSGSEVRRDGDPRVLPASNDEYAAIPHIGIRQLLPLRAAPHVQLVGVGHSTLDTLANAAAFLRRGGARSVDAGYITHMIGGKEALQKLVDNDITLLAPVSFGRLRQIDAELGAAVGFVHLESVPNTNSANVGKGLRANYYNYLTTEKGGEFADMADSGLPFASVIVNAGFEVGEGESKRRVAYLPEEARRHGLALGAHLPAGTNLFIAEGGPRNGFDREQNGWLDTLSIFRDAYLDAQALKGATPRVFEERFVKGAPYDAVKVALYNALRENCVAFISNAEGYGTMDGAVQWVPNTPGKKILGMFDFAAQHADGTGARAENTAKYHRWGIDLLEVNAEGRLEINRHPERRETPFSIENGAKTAVRALGIASAGLVQPNPDHVPQPR